MNINMSNNTDIVGLGNSISQNQEKKETFLGKLQKQMMGLDKQIAEVKENDQLSALEKKSRLQQLEEQKQELMAKIQEEQLQEKMKETEKKIEEAEERAAKNKEANQKTPTPLEEIKAELGIADIPTKNIIKASKALTTAQNKLNSSKKLKQEAKILKKEYEIDMGRGQSVNSEDYRLQKSINNISKADALEGEAYEALAKVNKLIKGAMEQVKKNKEVSNDIKEEIEEEKAVNNPQEENVTEKQEENAPVGSYVDIRV